MNVLLIAGIGVILAGLAAIGFGIPVKEFGFGNTLILTGTVGACTGLIMISMAMAVGELKKFALQAGAGEAYAPPLPRRDLPLADAADSAQPPVAGNSPLFSRDQPATGRSAQSDAGMPASPPWQDEVLRDRERLAAAATAAETAAPEEPKRRNLLFSSSRRERERAEATNAPDSGQDTVATAAEPSAEPPKSFEDAWPQPERPRSEALRRAARASSSFSDKLPDSSLIPDRYVPPEPVEAPKEPDVSVLKSGIVDGMAYKLYSDGSIEAQMPEGMMRFASIDDLRDHLDNRG